VVTIDSFELLKNLHNFGIVSENSAKTCEDIASIFNISSDEAECLLKELVTYKYVSVKRVDNLTLYYLNSRGIVAVCSMFT